METENEISQIDLPRWQKDLIDARLKEIADDPSYLRPIEELFELLDKEDD